MYQELVKLPFQFELTRAWEALPVQFRCECALQAGPISDSEIEDLVVSLHDIEVPTICCYILSTCATLSRHV